MLEAVALGAERDDLRVVRLSPDPAGLDMGVLARAALADKAGLGGDPRDPRLRPVDASEVRRRALLGLRLRLGDERSLALERGALHVSPP